MAMVDAFSRINGYKNHWRWVDKEKTELILGMRNVQRRLGRLAHGHSDCHFPGWFDHFHSLPKIFHPSSAIVFSASKRCTTAYAECPWPCLRPLSRSP